MLLLSGLVTGPSFKSISWLVLGKPTGGKITPTPPLLGLIQTEEWVKLKARSEIFDEMEIDGYLTDRCTEMYRKK